MNDSELTYLQRREKAEKLARFLQQHAAVTASSEAQQWSLDAADLLGRLDEATNRYHQALANYKDCAAAQQQVFLGTRDSLKVWANRLQDEALRQFSRKSLEYEVLLVVMKKIVSQRPVPLPDDFNRGGVLTELHRYEALHGSCFLAFGCCSEC